MGEFWYTSIVSSEKDEEAPDPDSMIMRNFSSIGDLDVAEIVEVENEEEMECQTMKSDENDKDEPIVMIQNEDPVTNTTCDQQPVAVIDLSEVMEASNYEELQNNNDNFIDILKEASIAICDDADSSNSLQRNDSQTNPNNNNLNYVVCDNMTTTENITQNNNDRNIMNNNCHNIISLIENLIGLKEYPKFDAELATTNFQYKCDLGALLEAERRVLLQPMEVLCHIDEDGDTPLMIVVSKKLEESPRLYENLFALQERILGMRMCCQTLMAEYELSCSLCGSSDIKDHHTTLSLKNKMGDSALTCAIKMQHPQEIIDYILAGLNRNENDIKRIFDESGIHFFRHNLQYYPSLVTVMRQVQKLYQKTA